MKIQEVTDSTTPNRPPSAFHDELLQDTGDSDVDSSSKDAPPSWLNDIEIIDVEPHAVTDPSDRPGGSVEKEPVVTLPEPPPGADASEFYENLTQQYTNEVNDLTLIGKLYDNLIPANEANQKEAFDAWLKTVPPDQLAERLKDLQKKINPPEGSLGMFESYLSLDVQMNGDKVQDVAFTYHNILGPALEWWPNGIINYSTDLYDPKPITT